MLLLYLNRTLMVLVNLHMTLKRGIRSMVLRGELPIIECGGRKLSL